MKDFLRVGILLALAAVVGLGARFVYAYVGSPAALLD